MGAIAARQGDAERAARLLGAAQSVANVLADAAGVRLGQELFSPARERLGERRWDAAYAEVARLDFDDAVSLALDES